MTKSLSKEGIPLGDIADHHVERLLASSEPVHAALGVNIRNARWFPDLLRPSLLLNMDITSQMQGWSGIIHGGMTDFLLHDVTGLAALLYARRQDRIVLGSTFTATYTRPLPLRTPVQITAVIEDGSEADYISCSGVVRQDIGRVDAQGKSYAEGVLRVKMVAEIRAQRA